MLEPEDDKTYHIETQTPLYTSDWYVKWVCTVIVIVAVLCRSVEEIPKIYDVVLSWFGAIGWLYVSLAWNDRALILLNGVLTFILSLAVLRHIFV